MQFTELQPFTPVKRPSCPFLIDYGGYDYVDIIMDILFTAEEFDITFMMIKTLDDDECVLEINTILVPNIFVY